LDFASNDRGKLTHDIDVSQRQDIPRRYLEPILQRFVHGGILLSVRGARGGYRLARPANKITLAEIDGLVAQMEVSKGIADHSPASRLGHEIVLPLMIDLQRKWDKLLNKHTVSELLSRHPEIMASAPSTKARTGKRT
jgi:Rrf2 family transcriptional regulator, iron-sulfur cluster assembly transcription factor